MNRLFATLIFLFASSLEAGTSKTADEIPCFAQKDAKVYYSVQRKNAIYENTTRLNFVYPEGHSSNKKIVEFYRKACRHRTKTLAEHRIPVLRLLVPGDSQSIWIDKDGQIEFDAWDTDLPVSTGLEVIKIIQDEHEASLKRKGISPVPNEVVK